MTVDISLIEYGEAEFQIPEESARKIADLAGEAVSVSLGPNGGFMIKANSRVGGLVTPELSLLIRPKVEMANVFEMLGVDARSHRFLRHSLFLESAPDLLAAIVQMFVGAVEDAQRRGIVRGYVNRTERLRALRGRIDFNGMLRRAGIAVPVAARYDDFTRDIEINRYVLTALRRAYRIARLPRRLMRRLNRAEATFEGSVEGAAVDVDWPDSWMPTQIDRHWEGAVRLAQIVLKDLTLRDRLGDRSATAFFVDMNELFETWLTTELTQALGPDLEVRGQVGMHLGKGRAVFMKPDLVVYRDGVAAVVADVKYKLLDGEARNPDYYQALAYATALGLPSATLLYALVPGTDAAEPVEVLNSEVGLHAVGLRLGGPDGSLQGAVREAATHLSMEQSSHTASQLDMV